MPRRLLTAAERRERWGKRAEAVAQKRREDVLRRKELGEKYFTQPLTKNRRLYPLRVFIAMVNKEIPQKDAAFMLGCGVTTLKRFKAAIKTNSSVSNSSLTEAKTKPKAHGR